MYTCVLSSCTINAIGFIHPFLPDVCVACLSRSDPRLEVVVDDAKKHLEECKETFDVIIMDIVDPNKGPGGALYTKEYYQAIKDHLNPGGVFVTQAGPCDVHVCKFGWTMVGSTIRDVFGEDRVDSYCSHVPSFTHKWYAAVFLFSLPCLYQAVLMSVFVFS
jgi:spermidine synthase